MCSRIKSVTNQIRKINAERCEVYHKMSESERPFKVGCLSLEYIFSGICGEIILRYCESAEARGLLKFMKQGSLTVEFHCSVSKQ